MSQELFTNDNLPHLKITTKKFIRVKEYHDDPKLAELYLPRNGKTFDTRKTIADAELVSWRENLHKILSFDGIVTPTGIQRYEMFLTDDPTTDENKDFAVRAQRVKELSNECEAWVLDPKNVSPEQVDKLGMVDSSELNICETGVNIKYQRFILGDKDTKHSSELIFERTFAFDSREVKHFTLEFRMYLNYLNAAFVGSSPDARRVQSIHNNPMYQLISLIATFQYFTQHGCMTPQIYLALIAGKDIPFRNTLETFSMPMTLNAQVLDEMRSALVFAVDQRSPDKVKNLWLKQILGGRTKMQTKYVGSKRRQYVDPEGKDRADLLTLRVKANELDF